MLQVNAWIDSLLPEMILMEAQRSGDPLSSESLEKISLSCNVMISLFLTLRARTNLVVELQDIGTGYRGQTVRVAWKNRRKSRETKRRIGVNPIHGQTKIEFRICTYDMKHMIQFLITELAPSIHFFDFPPWIVKHHDVSYRTNRPLQTRHTSLRDDYEWRFCYCFVNEETSFYNTLTKPLAATLPLL